MELIKEFPEKGALQERDAPHLTSWPMCQFRYHSANAEEGPMPVELGDTPSKANRNVGLWSL